MTRQEAHEFIRLYRQFTQETDGVKITDLISDEEIELQVGVNFRSYNDWTAAKVIEANSTNYTEGIEA